MHLPEPPQPKRKTRLGFKRSMVILRRNAPFRRLIAAFFLNGLANAFPATLFLLFAGRILGADPKTTGILLLCYFATAVVGLPLWLHLAKKYGKHHVWCGAMLAACLIFLPAFFLGAGDTIAFGLICVLSGFMLGADLALPPAIQADVIDTDTAKSGENRAGLYLALWSLVTKLTTALAVGLAFPLLEGAGFEATAFQQPSAALWMLAGLYALLPVALKIAAIKIMWDFPLDAAKQTALRTKISQLHT
jgi:Na+/melibiose symporter-like transporter